MYYQIYESLTNGLVNSYKLKDVNEVSMKTFVECVSKKENVNFVEVCGPYDDEEHKVWMSE